MNAREVSRKLNEISPLFEEGNRNKGFFGSRFFIKIDLDATGEISDIRLEKINCIQRLIRKIFGLGSAQGITQVAQILDGRFKVKRLDPEGKNCINKVIELWYRSPIRKGRCPLRQIWHWPKNRWDLGLIREEEIKQIEDFLYTEQESIHTEAPLPQLPKRRIPFTRGETKWTLPRTLFFLPNRHPVILPDLTIGVIGTGSERTVKYAYDLSKGRFLAKVPIGEGVERKLLHYFYSNPTRGIVKCLGFRKVLDNEGGMKEQVIQPKYRKSLHEAIRSILSLPFSTKLTIMRDLFEGLKTIHSFTTTLKNLQEKNSNNLIPPFRYPITHHDIKPSNILVDDKNKAVLTDFGYCGKAASFCGTRGFLPPEYVRKMHQPHDPNLGRAQFIVKTNIKMGRPKDVWAMGLTLASLFLEQTKIGGTAPLPSIQALLEIRKEKIEDKGLMRLTQADLDRDIDQIIKRAPNGEKHKITVAVWELIRRCLLVDWKKRCTSEEALQASEAILKLQKDRIKRKKAGISPKEYF